MHARKPRREAMVRRISGSACGANRAARRLAPLLAALLFAAAAPAAEPVVEPAAEQAALPAAGQSAAPAPTAAELADIIPRASRTANRLADLQRTLEELGTPPVSPATLDKHRERVRELVQKLEGLGQTGTAGYVQFADLKRAVRAEQEELGRLSDRLSDALGRIDKLRDEWQREEAFWAEAETALEGAAGSESVQTALVAAQQDTERALSLLNEAVEPGLRLQRELAQIQGHLQKTAAALDGMLRSLRDDLYRRSGFPLPSRGFWSQLTPDLFHELRQGISQVAWPGRTFFQTHGWVLLLQIAAAALLARLIQRSEAALHSSERWRFLAGRPFSAAVLVGFSLFAPLYTAAALPSWRLLLWAIYTLSAARLLGGWVGEGWKRRLLYLLAGVFLFTQALRVFGVPLPLFRLYVFTVGLSGALLCLWRARVSGQRGASRWHLSLLRTGAGVLALTALAQLAGYGAFATHLLTASIQTAFVLLLGWTLARLAHGALEYAFGPDSVLYRYEPLRRDARRLVARLRFIVNLVLGALGVGLVLEIWRIYPSSLEALSALLAMGFSVGEVRITLGLVLAAFGILYLAVLVSELIQELLMAEVYSRRHMEWGVRVSMNRLVHYGIIAVAFFLAVGTLGVDFQNITILAGAFGIGIGFGLQNIVNNFVSGLILLFERPIKVGDVVMIDGEWATIQKLGLRATIVQTFGRSDVIVPNSDLVSNKVVNWTLSDRLVRVPIPVRVKYGSDVGLTMQTLQQVADAHPLVASEPRAHVLFMEFGNSALEFELRVWVEVDSFLTVRSELHQTLDREFRRHGIAIAFPQRDLHLRTVDSRARRSLHAVFGGESGKEAESGTGPEADKA